jgi:hypothetical protein
MIFGLGAGKIEIILEKYNFSPGEVIKGKVSLELKKPSLAKKLKITLAGVRITNQPVNRPNRPPSTETRKDFIHHFELILDGEKEYSKGEYPFEIKIPDNILGVSSLPKEPTEGVLGVVLKTAETLSKMSGATSRIEWYLEADLEIPGAFDVKKKVDITVG